MSKKNTKWPGVCPHCHLNVLVDVEDQAKEGRFLFTCEYCGNSWALYHFNKLEETSKMKAEAILRGDE